MDGATVRINIVVTFLFLTLVVGLWEMLWAYECCSSKGFVESALDVLLSLLMGVGLLLRYELARKATIWVSGILIALELFLILSVIFAISFSRSDASSGLGAVLAGYLVSVVMHSEAIALLSNSKVKMAFNPNNLSKRDAEKLGAPS